MRARPVSGLDPGSALGENAARVAAVRVAELESFAAAALEPGALDAQHDMRIAAKRLRYVLEIIGPCFGESGERCRAAAEQIQDLLGEIRDADLLEARVRTECGDGAGEVLERLREDREAAFREFTDTWRRACESGVFAALLQEPST